MKEAWRFTLRQWLAIPREPQNACMTVTGGSSSTQKRSVSHDEDFQQWSCSAVVMKTDAWKCYWISAMGMEVSHITMFFKSFSGLWLLTKFWLYVLFNLI